MKYSEKGITLISLVVTIVVLSILTSVLVRASVEGNPVLEEVKGIENDYYKEKENTEEKVNSMVTGWENVIL